MKNHFLPERKTVEPDLVEIIRHAQSCSNAGQKTKTPGDFGITAIGQKQAELLSEVFADCPSQIVHSPYIRTKLTAAPTVTKFPQTPVHEWKIEEFTYLSPQKFSGTSQMERKSAVEAYWEKASPHHRDGTMAESFFDFWRRAEEFEKKLIRALPGTKVFTHEYLINLIRFRNYWPNYEEPNSEVMRLFRIFGDVERIPNTARISINRTLGGLIELGNPRVDHLPKELVTL